MVNPRIRRLHEIVDVGASGDTLSRAYDFFGVFCIVVNLCVSVLSTFDGVEAHWGHALDGVETATVVFFLADYVLRFISARAAYPSLPPRRASLRYVFSFMGIIDLLSFLPYFLPVFFPEGVIAFRLFRLARIFRLFRVGVYSDSLTVITQVLKSKKQQLVSSMFIIAVLMLASSLCMYSLEHEAQPEVFRNAFSGIWWSVSTLLTVGYGDIYPVTAAGKVFSIILTFLGVGMVAIPTGIISAGFVEQYALTKRREEYLRETDVNFIKFVLHETDAWVGKKIKDTGLPASTIIAVVRRGKDTIVPRGDVVLRAGDSIVLGAEPYNDNNDVELKELVLSAHSHWIGKRIRDLDISRQTLIIMVKRGDRVLVPNGGLVLQVGDTVISYSKQEVAPDETAL